MPYRDPQILRLGHSAAGASYSRAAHPETASPSAPHASPRSAANYSRLSRIQRSALGWMQKAEYKRLIPRTVFSLVSAIEPSPYAVQKRARWLVHPLRHEDRSYWYEVALCHAHRRAASSLWPAAPRRPGDRTGGATQRHGNLPWRLDFRELAGRLSPHKAGEAMPFSSSSTRAESCFCRCYSRLRLTLVTAWTRIAKRSLLDRTHNSPISP